MKVAIVAFPVGRSGAIALRQLAQVLHTAAQEQLVVISGGEADKEIEALSGVSIVAVRHPPRNGSLRRYAGFALTHLRLAQHVWWLRRRIDVLVTFIGGTEMVPALAIGRLLGKRCILSLAGTPGGDVPLGSKQEARVLGLLRRVALSLATTVVAYSPSVARAPDLRPHRRKTVVAHQHFLDTEFTTEPRPVATRPLFVGFLGRHSSEKGILEFV